MEFNFYDTLTRIMLEQGIKKTDIIRDLNISKNSFFFWKKNGNIPNGDTLKKLSDYLNVSIDVLAGVPEAEHDPGIKKDPSIPEGSKERSVTTDDVKVALFGGDGEVTDEMWEEAKFAAQLIKDRHKRKGVK